MPRWPTRTPEERFWEKVNKSPSCWLWTASTTSRGYGQFVMSAKDHRLAHVFSYELVHGPTPPGFMIDHVSCVPMCVRPDHLRMVTAKQNLENRLNLNSNNTSGARGVHWDKKARKWRAQVTHDRRQIIVGYFDDLTEAEEAVTMKRLTLFTHNTLDQGVARIETVN